MEQKKDTYYTNQKNNAAFERCIDVMSRRILKYGPDALENVVREETAKAQEKAQEAVQ